MLASVLLSYQSLAEMTKALTKLETAIDAQQKKLAQLKAKKQKMDALQKARITGLARRQDTRRKVLAGALLLELMNKDPELQKQMLGKLSGFLIRPEDRVLFGLKSAGE